MVILGMPKDANWRNKYIAISDKLMNKDLQRHGFFPIYWNDETMYYRKNVEIKDYIQKVGVQIEQ